MKVQNLCVAVAGLLAVTAQSANAADWGYGERGAARTYPVPAVAVPAPVPIPDYRPSWYFRLDAGIGTIGSPSLSERGYQYGGLINGGAYTSGTTGDNAYGAPGASGPLLQSVDPTWFSSDFSNLATFGGGVGYYLGGGWRIDATIEKRSNDQAQFSATETWDSYSYYGGGPLVFGTDRNGATLPVDSRTTLNVIDRVDVDGTAWLGNLYYDLASHRGFTPYIGLGLGFVWHQFDRTHSTTVTQCDAEATPGCSGGATVYSTSASTSANKVALAAAAMVGLSYDVSDITAIDVGYRYLYLGGADVVMDIDGSPSRFSIGDQHIHQVRAGLRFNVN